MLKTPLELITGVKFVTPATVTGALGPPPPPPPPPEDCVVNEFSPETVIKPVPPIVAVDFTRK